MNWKILFVCFAFASVAEAEITRKVLEYEFGNQITRSSLVVLSNGLVMQTRSTIFKATYIEDLHLDSNQMNQMIALVDGADAARAITNDKIRARGEGPYGELIGYTSDGRQAVIYGLSAGEGNTKTLECRWGSEGDELRSFINNRVRDFMPLRDIPCSKFKSSALPQ